MSRFRLFFFCAGVGISAPKPTRSSSPHEMAHDNPPRAERISGVRLAGHEVRVLLTKPRGAGLAVVSHHQHAPRVIKLSERPLQAAAATRPLQHIPTSTGL